MWKKCDQGIGVRELHIALYIFSIHMNARKSKRRYLTFVRHVRTPEAFAVVDTTNELKRKRAKQYERMESLSSTW